jgi:hypothetical protein
MGRLTRRPFIVLSAGLILILGVDLGAVSLVRYTLSGEDSYEFCVRRWRRHGSAAGSEGRWVQAVVQSDPDGHRLREQRRTTNTAALAVKRSNR